MDITATPMTASHDDAAMNVLLTIPPTDQEAAAASLAFWEASKARGQPIWPGIEAIESAIMAFQNQRAQDLSQPT